MADRISTGDMQIDSGALSWKGETLPLDEVAVVTPRITSRTAMLATAGYVALILAVGAGFVIWENRAEASASASGLPPIPAILTGLAVCVLVAWGLTRWAKGPNRPGEVVFALTGKRGLIVPTATVADAKDIAARVDRAKGIEPGDGATVPAE